MSNTFSKDPRVSSFPSPPDRQERLRALDIDQSWIVEAPAGAGKTGLLIQRFLKLLASATTEQPEQVLAITFTRKATFEMLARVLGQLEKARRGAVAEDQFDRETRPLAEAVLARDTELGWNLLDNPRRLNLRTIDSVCNEITGAIPVLSGTGGRLTATEEAAPLFAETARRTLLLLGGDDQELTTSLKVLLLHRDANLSDCSKLIAQMLSWREQWIELLPPGGKEIDDVFLDREVLPKLDRALDTAVCRALGRISRVLPGDLLDRLCTLASEMGRAEGYDGNPSPIALCTGRASPPEEKAAHVDHWRALIHLLLTKEGDFRQGRGINRKNLGFLIGRSDRTELNRLIDRVRHDDALQETLGTIRSLPPSRYPRDQWIVAKSLFRVLSRSLAELQVVFAEREQCDFAELNLLARSALRQDRNAHDLRSSAMNDLRHLLVDEMQDTSSGQYELIQLLTRHWDGVRKTIFLVGDPKQSIYLFRQARVERFLSTIASGQFGDLRLGRVRLTANFRSKRNLVEALNDDFSQLFRKTDSSDGVDVIHFLPATAVHGPSSEAARLWHINTLPYNASATESAAAVRRQARASAIEIRRIVERWRRRPLPSDRQKPWRIAILVRNRSHLLDIVQAFKRDDGFGSIPFRAVDIEPLGERQEILDLFALLRALLHPADRTAWLALLRTPWCGLTLVDLHLLAGSDDPAFATKTVLELMRERGDLLTPDGIDRLQRFWRVMTISQEQHASLSISQRVHLIWCAFGAPAYATPEELTNAERFFVLLDDIERAGGPIDAAKLAERLRKLYAAPAAGPDAVDLMTIHGAKGLEWDVILVPALERVGQTSPGKLLSWLELDSFGHSREEGLPSGIIAPIKSRGGPGQELNEWMRGLEAAREASELKRVFYVACTRAREELHLFAAPVRKKDGRVAIPSKSLLAAARDVYEQAVTEEQANLIQMPRPSLALAASAAEPVVTTTKLISRIPLEPASIHFLPAPRASNSQPASPPGSFAARAFGNAMHTFLELLATRIADGTNANALVVEVPTWVPRMIAILRSAGLTASHSKRVSTDLVQGLVKTLTSADGRWILADHPQSATERAYISWDERRTSIRVDRTFLGGANPQAHGAEYLWVVDYKTATHGALGLDEFLDREKAKYKRQLDAYSRALRSKNQPARLALFFPMLGKLKWWRAEVDEQEPR